MENTFEKELEQLINRYSKENESSTPDFILAEYMNDCLKAYNKAAIGRQQWHAPRIEFMSNGFCSCHKSEFHTINGAMICANCNRPMVNLAYL